MNEIEGRKAIVLLSTGVDTFSKLTFDKTRKALQNAGVPIYGIGLMQTYRSCGRLLLHGSSRARFSEADNQMRTFAKETGGMSFFPRFYSEFPSIFRNISDSLRNQYTMTDTDQPDSRRKVPEDRSRIGESGYRRTAPWCGPERSPINTRSSRSRVTRRSRSRIALTQKA